MKQFYRNKKQDRKEENSLRQKGSLTVESAFVLPFFFLAMIFLISILDLYRGEILLESVLCEAAKELGMYAYCTGEDSESPLGVVNQAVCIAYGTGKVRKCLEESNLIGIREEEISLLNSGYREDMIELNASFLYRSPIGIFSVFPVRIQISGQARAWNGYGGKKYGEGLDEELVYVTEWESVYHSSAECSHIRLSIHAVSRADARERTNEYGSHYQPCDKCCSSEKNHGTVYITETGDCYHSSRNCGGLTRHVKAVKKSETEAMRECSRCGRGE